MPSGNELGRLNRRRLHHLDVRLDRCRKDGIDTRRILAAASGFT